MNSIETAYTSTIYDVVYKDINYAVVFDTDFNIDYTDINILKEGNPLNISPLFDEIVAYVQEQLSKEDIAWKQQS